MFEDWWADYHARREAKARAKATKPLCSWCGAPTDVPGYKASWLEQRLARRIRNQRFRLRELEKMRGWHTLPYERWMKHALRFGQENKELRERIAALEKAQGCDCPEAHEAHCRLGG